MHKLIIQGHTLCKHNRVTERVTMKMTCSSTFREPATGLSCLPLYAGTRLYVKFKHMSYYCMGIFYAVL